MLTKRIVLITIALFLTLALFSFASGTAEKQAEPAEEPKEEPEEEQTASEPGLSTGKFNSLVDVPGIEVGNYQEQHTGTTVVLARDGAVGAVDVRGSAPGTRETDLLNPLNLVDNVNAVVLSGGSAYGLAAADGVMHWLEERGIGWPVGGGNVVPIVPSAILFDPGRFGRVFTFRPDEEFGRKAADNLSAGPFEQGNSGAGAGAVAGGLKGGLGTASMLVGNGVVVGAIVAVNSGGSTINPETGEFYASFLEIGDEFGELKAPMTSISGGDALALASEPVKNTTIAVIAVNVELTKAQAQKIAEMAHDGMARAIRPSHTMFDGDTVFVLGTGELSPEVLGEEAAWGYMPANINRIGSAAADTLSRAIVHAMLNAETVGEVQSYLDKYPGAR